MPAVGKGTASCVALPTSDWSAPVLGPGCWTVDDRYKSGSPWSGVRVSCSAAAVSGQDSCSL